MYLETKKISTFNNSKMEVVTSQQFAAINQFTGTYHLLIGILLVVIVSRFRWFEFINRLGKMKFKKNIGALYT